MFLGLFDDLFPNRHRTLALAIAKVIQLGTTSGSSGFNLNLRDTRGVDRENALDSFAITNPANRQRRVQESAFATNDNPRENLYALFLAFLNNGMNADAVANIEGGDFLLHLFLVDFLDNGHSNGSVNGLNFF